MIPQDMPSRLWKEVFSLNGPPHLLLRLQLPSPLLTFTGIKECFYQPFTDGSREGCRLLNPFRSRLQSSYSYAICWGRKCFAQNFIFLKDIRGNCLMEGWQDLVELLIIIICVFLLAIYVVPRLKIGFSWRDGKCRLVQSKSDSSKPHDSESAGDKADNNKSWTIDPLPSSS